MDKPTGTARNIKDKDEDDESDDEDDEDEDEDSDDEDADAQQPKKRRTAATTTTAAPANGNPIKRGRGRPPKAKPSTAAAAAAPKRPRGRPKTNTTTAKSTRPAKPSTETSGDGFVRDDNGLFSASPRSLPLLRALTSCIDALVQPDLALEQFIEDWVADYQSSRGEDEKVHVQELVVFFFRVSSSRFLAKLMLTPLAVLWCWLRD